MADEVNDAQSARLQRIRVRADDVQQMVATGVLQRTDRQQLVVREHLTGAAQSPLGGSGPYSIAKAGLEMLTRQIGAEQKAPAFRAISVRPGIIDTGMQAYMRALPRETYANVDMFREFHASGQLVPPDVVAAKIVDRLVLGEVENGRCYSYKEL